LGENEEFLVYRWSLPSESSKAPAATDQTLPSFYRPVAAASVPNAPLPPAVPPAVSSASAAAPTVPAATPAAASSTQIHCDLCGTGPFLSQLELQGHKSTVHPVRRTRKPGSKSSSITESKKPVKTPETPRTPVGTPVDTPTIPTASAPGPLTLSTVVPPVPTPIPFTASPEQATLPAAPTSTPSTPAAEVQAPAAAPVPGPAAPVSAPAPAAAAPTAPASTAPELVGGTSEAAQKYTKLCGLVKKSLAEFKLHFEANFPGQDIAKVLEASHCTIVDDRVVFTGGA
jgi:hypothetical protein